MTLEEAIKRIDNIIHQMSKYDVPLGYVLLSTDVNYLEVAKQALEKRIPKKLKIEKHNHTFCDCGHKFSIHLNDCYAIPFNNKTPYCPNCGQAIDWSDKR